MRTLTTTIALSAMCSIGVSSGWAGDVRLAQAPAAQAPSAADKSAPAEPKMPAKGAAQAVQIRATISAIDKDKGTVTLKGPQGRTVTLEVRDKQKFDVIKVGDPVVAKYVEALVVKVVKSGSASPGVSMQEARVTSKPGENPAGAIGREISITATVTAINKKAHTVTIKGPDGSTDTVKATNPKNLDAIKVGDLVDITYTQALAVALDKPAK